MKIQCTTTFLDGMRRFEAGDVVTVEDARGAYFVANGWAVVVRGAGAEAAAPSGGAVALDIHGAASGTGDSNG